MTKKKQSDSFIVTVDDENNYNLVENSILESYAIKSVEMDSVGSKQIHTDGWSYDILLQPLYDPHKLCDLLDLNTFHAACCDAVATDVSGNSWTLNPSKINEVDGNVEPPSNVMTFLNNIPDINNLFYKRTYDCRATGYGVIEIVREGKSDSPPQTLSHIPSYTLRRAKDGYRVKQKIGTKEVWFVIYGKNKETDGTQFDVNAETGEKAPYNSLAPDERANELLWVQEYTPKTEYYGNPPIISALRAISGDVHRAEYNSSFFKNYGMPAFSVIVTGDFADYDVDPSSADYDVTKTLKYKISQQLKQVIKNPHSAVTILVPSEGEEGNVEVKLEPLSVDTKEASFRLYRKDNRDEVLAAHGVPVYRVAVNETGNLGGSNIQGSNNIYNDKKIRPIIRTNENDINLLLKNEFECTDWVFSLPELDKKDYATDITLAKELFNMGAMTPRDLINNFGDKFGLKGPEDNDYMDSYFLNGKPIESVFTGGTTGAAVLDNLQNSLMEEAELYDNTTTEGEEGLSNPDGTKNKAIKEDTRSLRRTIQEAFSS